MPCDVAGLREALGGWTIHEGERQPTLIDGSRKQYLERPAPLLAQHRLTDVFRLPLLGIRSCSWISGWSSIGPCL